MLVLPARPAVLLLLFVLAAPAPANAGAGADSATAAPGLFDTDRPDITNGSGRLEPGVVQVETGWSRASQGDLVLNSLGDALVRIGVSRAFELRVSTPGLERATLAGTSDSEWGEMGVGFKVGKTSAAGDRGFAVVASIAAPVESHGARSTDTEAALAGDWASGNLGVSANVGIHRVSTGRDGENTGLASVSVADQLTRRCGTFFEIATEFEDRGSRAWSQFGDGGVSWAVAHHLQLDASAGRGFDAGDAWTLGAGVSKRW